MALTTWYPSQDAAQIEKALADKRAAADEAGEMLCNLPPDIKELKRQRALQQHLRNKETAAARAGEKKKKKVTIHPDTIIL